VLKVYRLADQCDLQRVQLYREIRVHSRLQHQNIVQFYAAFLVSCVCS
jgi:aurora kinase